MNDAQRQSSSLGNRLDRTIRTHLLAPVHTPLLGASRAILALSTMLTLLATPTPHLFFIGAGIVDGRICAGLADRIGLFCLVPASTEGLTAAKFAAVGILVWVAVGWRPRLSAFPHWWVCFSFSNSSNVIDGGDQVAAIASLLLIPICLTDGRKWHWNRPGQTSQPAAVIAHISLRLIWLQVAVVYLHASIGKLGVAEWQNGTNYWYWATTEPFGLPSHLHSIGTWALQYAPVVVATTWGAIAIEFYLALCLIKSQPWRRWGLFLGFLLHGGIALSLGLLSFAGTMCAVLLLYMRRPHDSGQLFPPSVVIAIKLPLRVLSRLKRSEQKPQAAPSTVSERNSERVP
ncbi:sporulation-delaying protein SdpB family protein [Nonomuraea rubra]|uniref:sporulation-delaying protein SdpB family protein n=1 Tax=Nonomuraea rubra TaxID=46180 RepID=UPI0033D7908F